MADIAKFYSDLRKLQASLEAEYPTGVVHVTSVENRQLNSLPGVTLSATAYNAARVITEGTHRLATKEEIAAFHTLQQDNHREASMAEQRRNKQFVVVVDPTQLAKTIPPQSQRAVAEK